MTETIHEKAQRFIAEDRVDILFQGDHYVDGEVRGDHGTYLVMVRVGIDATCTCPAAADCSHILAVLGVALESFGLPTAVMLA